MRSCGRCSVCCTVQGVKEGLPEPKPPGVRCSLLCRGRNRGCRIYDSRPQECQDYSCLWLQGVGEAPDRPDRIGVVFEVQDGVPDPGHPFVLARTTHRGKEVGKRAAALLADLKQRIFVLVVHPDQVQGWRTEMTIEVDPTRTDSGRPVHKGVSVPSRLRSWNVTPTGDSP